MHTTTRRLVTFAAALATSAAFMLGFGTSAQAATPSSTTCAGTLAPGHYKNVTVAGFCSIDGGASISGNVAVASGATAMLSGAKIGGNVSLTTGSIMMAFYSHFGGNVGATNAHALYLFNSAVGKNLAFNGGGSGPNCVDVNPDDQSSLGHDTMVKDTTIAGNVSFTGWSGCWFGFLRNTVGGNATISNMYANPLNINYPGTPDQVMQGLDSTEVGSNTIAGVLNCSNNTPAAQIGDSGATLNVARKGTGECATLVG